MSSNGDEDLAGQASRLSDEITRFADMLNGLDRRLGAEQRRVNAAVSRNKRLTVSVMVLVVLNLVLMALVGWNMYRIDVVQERTSSQVLCPLYDLFLGSYHPERQPPERLAEYERTFDVIRKSHQVLGCNG